MEQTQQPRSSVLIIAQEASVFTRLAGELRGLGVSVRRADGEVDALLSHLDSPAGLILCEADDLDWRRLLRVLYTIGSRTPVVLLTHTPDRYVWLEMLDAGAFDLLEEPYRAADLQWVVSSALQHETGGMASARVA